MTAPARRLAVVPPSTEQLTKQALIALDEAQAAHRHADALVKDLLRQLARERGVAFIRQESARMEMLK